MLPNDCDFNAEPSGFIGYRRIPGGVRIYLNCKDETHFESSVDVTFAEGAAQFGGLEQLSTIKKFHRLIGALEERAREADIARADVFATAERLLFFLSRVKNSKDFSPGR